MFLFYSFNRKMLSRFYWQNCRVLCSIDFIDGELQAVRVPTRRIKHLFGVEAEEIEGHPPIPPEPGGEAEE